MKKPGILLIHNTYFHRGGEDSVVQQELSSLKKNGYPVSTLFFDNNAYKKIGWRTLLAPSRLFFNISAFVKVYRIVKQQKIGFVHVHNFQYTASPSVFWAAKAAGATTLFTVHNFRLFCLNGLFFRDGATCMLCQDEKSFRPGIEHRCFKSSSVYSSMLASSINFHRKKETWQRKVDHFVVLNPLVEQLLLESGIPAEKIYRKDNFLTNELTGTYKDYHARENFYLFTGRMSEEKGIRHLVTAFKKNGKKLKLVGDGPLADWLQTQVDENIIYHTGMPRQDLFALYASCKALVFPSLWPEGQPMTIIEAQSTGALVLAGNRAITQKMVGDQYGFLYKNGDTDDLNCIITNFETLTTDQLNKMSVSAYNHFLQHYTETQHLHAVSEMYTNL